MGGIGEIFYDLYLLLPTWMLVIVGAIAAIVIVPGWLRRIRNGQLRGAIRGAIVARDEATREVAVVKALNFAGTKPKDLIYLVENARRMGQPTIALKALETLERLDGQQREVARLKAEAAPDKKSEHPMQIAISVERLLESGLLPRARSRLEEGLAIYPNDPDLRSLERRVVSAEQAAAAPQEHSS